MTPPSRSLCARWRPTPRISAADIPETVTSYDKALVVTSHEKRAWAAARPPSALTSNVRGSGARPFSNGGVRPGACRGWKACSKAKPRANNRASCSGLPSNSSPVGSPKPENPAGTLNAGSPVVALSWQFEPP